MPAGCNDLLECLDNRRVVPGAGQAPQFVDGFFGRLDGWTEHARLRDRVESITGVDDPRANWNFRSFQTVRVACAVPAFMVVANNLGDAPLFRVLGEDLGSFHRMGLDDFVLLRRKLRGLEENRIRDGDLAEVMQDSPHANRVANLLTEMERARHAFAHLSNPLGVTKGLTVALVDDSALHDERVPPPLL